MVDYLRYSRQTLVEEIGEDTIDESNLHRQVLYRERDIGLYKADVAERELQAINSKIRVSASSQRLSPKNVGEFCSGQTLVIDAADNFATSYLLSDACAEMSISLLSASVNRTFGYVGVFCKEAPSLRAVFPKLPANQASCDAVGVTGPSVGVVAGIQAQEALKVLLGKPSLAGKILYLDLWNYSQQIIDFSMATDTQTTGFKLISASQLSTEDWVVDVRTKDEIKQSPQSFSTNQHLDLQVDLQAVNLAELLDNTKRIVFACRTGQRAMIAAQRASEQGLSELAVVLPD